MFLLVRGWSKFSEIHWPEEAEKSEGTWKVLNSYFFWLVLFEGKSEKISMDFRRGTKLKGQNSIKSREFNSILIIIKTVGFLEFVFQINTEKKFFVYYKKTDLDIFDLIILELCWSKSKKIENSVLWHNLFWN